MLIVLGLFWPFSPFFLIFCGPFLAVFSLTVRGPEIDPGELLLSTVLYEHLVRNFICKKYRILTLLNAEFGIVGLFWTFGLLEFVKIFE